MNPIPSIKQHHAHLWIGDQQTLTQTLIFALQKAMCSKNCQTCIICTQIAQKEHAWIAWLEPEGSYTLDDIDTVLHAVRFTLDSNEKRFFIFTKAQELSSACSNRLLKTVEEPHHGYFFIFMTTKADDILPTLASRCLTQQFAESAIFHNYSEVTDPFLTSSLQSPIRFMKNIERLGIKEAETKQIIDSLIQQFHKQLSATHAQSTHDIQQMLQLTDRILLLKQALLQLPLAGSSKLFWKNLYLAFHHQIDG